MHLEDGGGTMSATTWVLVAEGSRARLFEMATPMSPLRELEAYTHPDGHLRGSERKSDAPGRYGTKKSARTRGTGITGGAHIFNRPNADDELQHSFARFLAEQLDRARNQGAFDRLVLIAAPSFLGSLRDQLSEPTRRCITQELGKNFAKSTPAEIREKVDGALLPF
jgi:protein required for attachment to host cells